MALKIWLTEEDATRGSFPGFDRAAIDLLMLALGKGAQVRVSNSNHAIVRGPGGATTAIPRKLKSNNRGCLNAEAAISRMFRN